MGATREWRSIRAATACLVTMAVAVAGAGLSLGAVATPVAASSVVPRATTGPGTVVPAKLFGIHVISVGNSNPNLPSGSIRMLFGVSAPESYCDWA